MIDVNERPLFHRGLCQEVHAIGRRRGRGTRRCGRMPIGGEIIPHDVEQHLVQPGELLAHDAAGGQQQLNDDGQPGQALDQIGMRASNPAWPNTPTFR